MTSERVWVKVCGITNQHDAIQAVECGADALGFIFARSPRQVTAEQVSAVLEVVPSSVLTFGVFVDEVAETVLSVVDSLGLDGAQLHGSESPEEVAYLSERIEYVIKAISVKERPVKEYPVKERPVELTAPYERSWAVLVDGPRAGSGQPFDWSTLMGISPSTRLILAGGLDADNVAHAISLLEPFGVDVSSGVEQSPGQKDETKLRAFVAAVHQSDRRDQTAVFEQKGEK